MFNAAGEELPKQVQQQLVEADQKFKELWEDFVKTYPERVKRFENEIEKIVEGWQNTPNNSITPKK